MFARKILLSWSSGKDSAWTLHLLRQDPDAEVVGLVTTVNQVFDRVAMHGVSRTLLEAQAEAAGVPLLVLPIPHPCPNEIYEGIMGEFIAGQARAGVEAMAFGDLFLEDIRRYREVRLAGTGVAPLFPLWGKDTALLAREMVEGGLVAHVTCLDPQRLPERFAGRRFDVRLLAELPAGIDPCGEKGEFHTFACAGPMFNQPIAVQTGEVVTRDGFVFCDLTGLPDPAAGSACKGEDLTHGKG